MGLRYFFVIDDKSPSNLSIAYIDTLDNLGDFAFDHLKVDKDVLMDFHYEGDPFKIVMCRVPKSQWKRLLSAIDALPRLMAYVGREGYDDYCKNLMNKAVGFLVSGRGPDRSLPLQ